MKASELIKLLQAHVDAGNDLDVYATVYDSEEGTMSTDVAKPEIEGIFYLGCGETKSLLHLSI